MRGWMVAIAVVAAVWIVSIGQTHMLTPILVLIAMGRRSAARELATLLPTSSPSPTTAQ